MPESMPYHLETGKTLGFIESFLNQQTSAQLKNLRSLLISKNLVDVINQTTNITVPHAGGQVPLSRAIADNWLGKPSQNPADQGAYVYDKTDDPANPGKWLFYQGRPDEILRQTFVRAIEISLGLDHQGVPQSGTAGRKWPFVLMWKCAQAWLEGWVQWRPGVVIVVICTPGDGNHIALDPDLGYDTATAVPPGETLSPFRKATLDGYARNPNTYRQKGSLVITHDQHSYDASVARSSTTNSKLLGGVAVAASNPGNPTAGAPIPWFGGKFMGGNQKIVAVSPAASDGGVP